MLNGNEPGRLSSSKAEMSVRFRTHADVRRVAPDLRPAAACGVEQTAAAAAASVAVDPCARMDIVGDYVASALRAGSITRNRRK
jgi:hypothetical protein